MMKLKVENYGKSPFPVREDSLQMQNTVFPTVFYIKVVVC